MTYYRSLGAIQREKHAALMSRDAHHHRSLMWHFWDAKVKELEKAEADYRAKQENEQRVMLP